MAASRRHAGQFGALAVAIPYKEAQPPRFGACVLRSTGVFERVVTSVIDEARAEVNKAMRRLEKDGEDDLAKIEEMALGAVRRAFRRRKTRAPQVVVLLTPFS